MKKMEETTEIETQSNSMFQDLKVIALEMRISAPLIIFFGFLLTYQLTIAPYRTYDVDRGQVIMRSEQLVGILRQTNAKNNNSI